MIDTSQFCGKKVAFHTLGCKLNFAETSVIGQMLFAEGFVRAKAGEQADICIINTCSVTNVADKKCRQAIHRLMERHPNAYIVVTGCYAQLKPDEVAQITGVDLVLGSNEKMALTDFLTHLDRNRRKQIHVGRTAKINAFQPACSADDRTRHFLKIQDGCNYYCSYCTIPLARGRSRNASIEQTLAVAQESIDRGAKEIVLTGVNIGAFETPKGETFLDLIKALDNLSGEVRFRISSIEPNLLRDEIIDFVKVSNHFAPHFHIPLQSGSNTILRLMRRRYTRELFAEKVKTVKRLMPDAFIGVDVMVGMRGETPDCFEETYAFLQELDITQMHVFTYSERNNTQALEIGYIVPQQERKRRSEALHRLSQEKTERFMDTQRGNSGIALWESGRRGEKMFGFTENYIRVEAPCDLSLINTFQSVVIT
ncbi:MAG: tRNA (N(6)-L-threonylcarbamoyladenosine(37)-C(2))-methylthiotransferase MtaB [Prevotellaceae bacterium]|jgi:threonylcarbamoyladenosine tRNA methylthiotransferase MtaB|nr:tRNA (N(6)-L-threonylcarbamoyladenosine(37)-C(2))-methylthiotransferase MtaB [Prevotellaceae bacterium]